MVFPFARRVSERGHGHPHGLRSRTQLLVRMLLCQPTAPGLPIWEPGTSVRRRFSCSSQTSSWLVTTLLRGHRKAKNNGGSKKMCRSSTTLANSWRAGFPYVERPRGQGLSFPLLTSYGSGAPICPAFVCGPWAAGLDDVRNETGHTNQRARSARWESRPGSHRDVVPWRSSLIECTLPLVDGGVADQFVKSWAPQLACVYTRHLS